MCQQAARWGTSAGQTLAGRATNTQAWLSSIRTCRAGVSCLLARLLLQAAPPAIDACGPAGPAASCTALEPPLSPCHLPAPASDEPLA